MQKLYGNEALCKLCIEGHVMKKPFNPNEDRSVDEQVDVEIDLQSDYALSITSTVVRLSDKKSTC